MENAVKKTTETFINFFREFPLPNLGYDINLYSDMSLHRFSTLPPDLQSKILEDLSFRIKIFSEINEYSKTTEKVVLEHVLNKMNAVCCESFLSKVTENDIVEIYSVSNVQLYANFLFFKFSTYSLMDMATHSWDELFGRDPIITKELFKQIAYVMTEADTIKPYNVSRHIVKELISKEKKSFLIEMRNMAPIFDAKTSRRIGMVHTLTVEPLNAVGDHSVTMLH